MAWRLAGIRGTAGTLDQVGMHQRYCCTVLSAQSARLDALSEGRSKGATLQAEHKAKISARERLVNPNMRSENKTSKVCLSARSYLIFGSKLQELAKWHEIECGGGGTAQFPPPTSLKNSNSSESHQIANILGRGPKIHHKDVF